jgi:hypothetical protein
MIYLVEVTAATDSAGTTTTLRFCSEAYVTKPTDTPANTYYEPRIKTPADITRNLFASGTTSGASRVGYGIVELANVDGGLDYMANYSYDNRALTIKIGNPEDAYSTFTTILAGTMEQVEFTFNTVTILARDKLAILDLPLQKTEFAGTNSLPSGLEGVGDIKGQKKPFCYGKVYNVQPPCVNTSRLIYQVNDAVISDVTAVYDKGAGLTKGSAYSSIADMEANAPSAGNYRVCSTSSGSYFRLGSTPAGLITCDVTQGASSSNRTAAQIIKAMAIKGGVSSGDINASDVTALDTANNAEVGIWVYGEDSGLTCIDQISESVGAWYGYDATGQFRMGRFAAASGAADIEINDDNIISIEAIRPSDTDRGIPAYKILLGYLKNYTVQTADVASSVTDARKSVLQYPTANTVATDATVQTQYLLATEIHRDTLLVDATAAGTEATRLLNLYKVKRTMYQISIALDVTETLPDLNGVANLTLNRFGLDSGTLFRIIGISSSYAKNRATLTLWG